MEPAIQSDGTVQLIAFFVAATISVVSSHIGLIRLIGSANKNASEAIAREKTGVLIVVEFGVVTLIGAPLPIAARFLDQNPSDIFTWANWFIPGTMLCLTIINVIISKLKSGWYFNIVAGLTFIASFTLFIAHCSGTAPNMLFVFSLCLSLAVIVSQFLKSALRLAGYLPE